MACSYSHSIHGPKIQIRLNCIITMFPSILECSATKLVVFVKRMNRWHATAHFVHLIEIHLKNVSSLEWDVHRVRYAQSPVSWYVLICIVFCCCFNVIQWFWFFCFLLFIEKTNENLVVADGQFRKIYKSDSRTLKKPNSVGICCWTPNLSAYPAAFCTLDNKMKSNC